MSPSPPTVFLTGGGTGGHVFPALAIAGEINKQRSDVRIVFIGTKNKIEERVVPRYGYEFRSIWISGFGRQLRFQLLLFPLKLIVSVIQSFFLIRKYRPLAVLGTGGYVCGPVLATASVLGIPVFLHESNSYPGATTRLLASRAQVVFLGFNAARSWLRPAVATQVVGTPTLSGAAAATREDALAHFKLDGRKPVVLITGGSQGAASINRAVTTAVSRLHQEADLIWQTGKAQEDHARGAVSGKAGVWIGEFIDRMDLAYTAATIVVSRAGATTLAEITRFGKPAILVPYPHAAEDHQTFNARALVDAGAAVLIPDRDLPDRLGKELLKLLGNPERLQQMAEAARQLGRPDAGRTIAETVLRSLKES